MSKLSVLVSLNSYADSASTNAPALNHFKWTREICNAAVDNPKSNEYSLAPFSSQTIFSGSRTLTQDLTTKYDIALKIGTPNTYVISWNSGTLPGFRTHRSTAGASDTTVLVTMSGTVATITQNSGTALDFSTVQIGDEIKIGDAFAVSNQVTSIVIAKTATSVSFENVNGVAEGPVTLGATFADQIIVQSTSPVQVGDKVVIDNGFSIASFGSYEITAVYWDSIEFYSSKPLAAESAVTASLLIYSVAKRLVYVETNDKVSVSINGAAAVTVEPLVSASGKAPGMMLLTQNIHTLSVSNSNVTPIVIYVACVE